MPHQQGILPCHQPVADSSTWLQPKGCMPCQQSVCPLTRCVTQPPGYNQGDAFPVSRVCVPQVYDSAALVDLPGCHISRRDSHDTILFVFITSQCSDKITLYCLFWLKPLPVHPNPLELSSAAPWIGVTHLSHSPLHPKPYTGRG